MGNIVNSAVSAGAKASGLSGAFNAAKGVVHGIESVLGLGGPSEAERRRRAYVGYHKIIRSGDYQAMWQGAQRAKYAGGRWELLWAYYNRSSDANAAEAARRLAGLSKDPRADSGTFSYPVGPDPQYFGGVPSSPTSAPDAGNGSQPAPSTSPTGNSPAAPASQKPCKYGRNPLTGKCYTKSDSLASGTSAGSSGSQAAPFTSATAPCKYGPRGPDGKCPCKYGPRDANGRCPKAPNPYSGGSAGTTGRPQSTAARRAEAAALRRAESAVTAGLTKAGKAAVVAAGGIGPAAVALGQLALIGAAGYLAYRITAKLLTVRYQTWDDLQLEVANEYRRARQELAGMTAENEGRALTPAELKNTSDWYKNASGRLRRLKASGADVRDVGSLIFGDT